MKIIFMDFVIHVTGTDVYVMRLANYLAVRRGERVRTRQCVVRTHLRAVLRRELRRIVRVHLRPVLRSECAALIERVQEVLHVTRYLRS